MSYPSQHLSLEYEPDDFSDKSSRDGSEGAGSRSILLIDDDEEDASPPSALPQDSLTLWPETASDTSGWTSSSSRLSSVAADRPSRRRRPRPWDGLPPTSGASDARKTLTSQPSGERTPLLKQSSKLSVSSSATQQVRNTRAYDATSGRTDEPLDNITSKRMAHSNSPTFSSAQSSAPTVSTFASFFSRIGRRKRDTLRSPPTHFSWSGDFFSGNGTHSSEPPTYHENGYPWTRFMGGQKEGTSAFKNSSHGPQVVNRSSESNVTSTSKSQKSIHHATFRASASNHFYLQNDSYDDTEEPSTFIHSTLLNGKKKRQDWFVSSLTLLMIIHFVAMMGYEVLLWYISFRRGQRNTNNQDNYDTLGAWTMDQTPPFWLSSAGRIYNPSIGPSPTTLTLFGIFNPTLALLKKQYWRFLTSLTLCSSFVQLILNCVVLITVVAPLEERYGSGTMGFTYVLCAWAGGIFSLLFSCSQNPNIPKILIRSTTLTCAGLTGIAVVGVIERVFSQTREKVFNRLHSAAGKKKSGFFIIFTADRWGLPHFGIVLGLTNAIFTSFASPESILAGGIMGTCCGVLLFADMLRCLDEDEDEDDTWSTEDETSIASFSDIDRPFAMSHTPAWGEDEQNFLQSNHGSLKGTKMSITGLDTEDLRLRSGFSTSESAFAIGDASSPLKSPKKSRSQRSDALGTSGYLQMLALVVGLCCLFMPLLFIGMVLWLPSDQSMKDSIHGCISVYSFYDYSVVDDQHEDMPQLVCGEICVPYTVYRRIPLLAPDLISDTGSCSSQGYTCHLMSDFMAIGDKYDLSREVYASSSSCSS